jgi:hypothetical protein
MSRLTPLTPRWLAPPIGLQGCERHADGPALVRRRFWRRRLRKIPHLPSPTLCGISRKPRQLTRMRPSPRHCGVRRNPRRRCQLGQMTYLPSPFRRKRRSSASRCISNNCSSRCPPASDIRVLNISDARRWPLQALGKRRPALQAFRRVLGSRDEPERQQRHTLSRIQMGYCGLSE